MSAKTLSCTLLAIGFASLGVAADDLLPQKSVSVKDRTRPGYEATGITLGTIRLTPRAGLSEIYDDNVFATGDGKTDDYITVLSATLGAQTTGRTPASLYLGVESESYADSQLENITDWRGGGTVSYDLGSRTRIALGGDYIREHEVRSDPGFPASAVERPSFSTAGGLLEITQDFATGRAKLIGDYRSVDFRDSRLDDGQILDQDYRDRDTSSLEARADFVVRRSAALFVRLIHRQQDYRFNTDPSRLSRASRSEALYGGGVLNLTDLMRGEIGIGVMDVNNRDPSQSDRRVLAISSNIEFYLTQLITLTINIQRSSEAADIQGSASYLNTKASAALDYELRRNLLLSANWSLSHRSYSGAEDDESDNRTSLGATWLLNKSLRANLGVSSAHRSWPQFGPSRQYAQRTVLASVSFAL